MPDDTTGPKATPVIATPSFMQPSPQQVFMERENSALAKILRGHDDARAKAATVTLICVAPFMMVNDENPDGVIVERGQEFEISEFDLPRYLGRGLFRNDDPRRNKSHG